MQEIDVFIDQQTDYAEELVRLSISNQEAHDELQSFNDCKQFKYKHPIAENFRYKQSQQDELYKLLYKDTEKFMDEITNTRQNIRRIESNLNKEKYKNEEERRNWIANLNNARSKLQVMKDLISK